MWSATQAWAFDPTSPWLFAALGAFIVFGWIVVLLVQGGRTGWRELARTYPAVERGNGQRLLINTARFRRGGYRNLVVLEADASHLHFRLLPRLGHPPFSVPWAEITARADDPWWGWPQIRFTFARAPELPMKVHPRIAERIAAASGGRLRVGEEAATGARWRPTP